ncbi:hypothetical protein KBY58_05345 [Cyanobium sp. HWJ4-Hawea]|uniref:hypothetical protein n=1 Tax=Cyanobium sp. HWJ4-Hawea TaxID=2823713 RepID=UPI0020CD3135|nr:hypothetical protein [Cyanobium sp. HWJ4-Hawea]MCP9808852.1 hypothetical protein [Cyanobium sp. HWJ4-Hawea]
MKMLNLSFDLSIAKAPCQALGDRISFSVIHRCRHGLFLQIRTANHDKSLLSEAFRSPTPFGDAACELSWFWDSVVAGLELIRLGIKSIAVLICGPEFIHNCPVFVIVVC